MLGSINRISDWPVFTRVRRKPVKNESLNFSRREINRLLSLPCTSVSTSLILISFSAVLLQTLITFVLHIAKLFCVILRQNLDLKFHDQSRYHILNNYQHGHEKFISNVKSLIHTMDRIWDIRYDTNISYSSHYYYISRSFARKSQDYGFFN